MKYETQIKDFLDKVSIRNKSEPEFLQAVEEFANVIIPFVEENPKYKQNNLLERIVEPERVISFRVSWLDDNNETQVNRGYRIQFNSAIGPYKGGIRFHPSVNQGILKFLGFEQVFKNSLTSLPMGGGKGGADFDPKGKSDTEIMKFCQSFMTELQRHIGQHSDVPAGDIGVGGREVGYMFGQYKRIKNEFTGILTGKGQSFGGSLIRPEATGYGSVYFAREALTNAGNSISAKVATVSGSGNVAQYTIEKLIELGAKVVTASDSSGYIYDKDGITQEKLEFLKDLKNVKRGRIKEYADKFGVDFFAGERPWNIKCDLAFPSATQNEINKDDATTLVKNGCILVSEGANMPTTNEGIDVFLESKILYLPAKAANAGGVAVSGLEMSQNSQRLSWSREDLDKQLLSIMKNIHSQCINYGTEGDFVNYVKGANIAGFIKVADAMIAQGTI